MEMSQKTGDEGMTELPLPQEPAWADNFDPRLLSASDAETVKGVREAFKSLANALQVALPPGRYKHIVLTQLETAAMYATKAISHA